MAVTISPAQALADGNRKEARRSWHERLLPVASALGRLATGRKWLLMPKSRMRRLSGAQRMAWLNQPASANCVSGSSGYSAGGLDTDVRLPSFDWERCAVRGAMGLAESTFKVRRGGAYSWERCRDSRKPRYSGSRRGLHVPFPSGFCWRRGCRRFFG